METTYTMIGGDGLQYGPITLDQLKAWVNEGRVTGDTKILRSDTNAWLRAAQYAELGLAPAIAAGAAAPASATPVSPQSISPQPVMGPDPVLLRRVRSAAGWFFAIAVLSALNVILATSHQPIRFLFGLGVSRYFPLEPVLGISAVFALFGVFARRNQSWAFIIGMILYALDGVMIYGSQSWLPLAFHVYVLFRIGLGLKANMDLKSQNP